VSQGGQSPEGPLGVARAALAALEASRTRIDDLNVYPVPDGDTGTNMAETVRAVVSALERDPGADIVRSALMGARGNSGVILSQLVRGAVEALDRGAMNAALLAKALRGASDAGYAAVPNAQEGTMLTVARGLAEKAEELAPAGPPLDEALAEIVAHGEKALAETTDQLDILKQAGVVDAGGAGVLEIMRGIAAHVRGEPLPEPEAVTGGIPLEAVHLELSRYRYCTSFFVEGAQVDPEELERELTKLGDSLLVVGGPGAVKVHVHTDDPGAAIALATGRGVIGQVDIENMHAQVAGRTERLEREAGVTGTVAVVLGEGNRRLFESLGAATVDGGETMNPSTADLLAAVEALPEPGVVLLPNSENVILAAEQAAEQSAKDVRVVPTRSLQSGLGALIAFDAAHTLEENVAEMGEAAAAVRAGSVAHASRSAKIGDVDVEEGEFLGLVEGEPVTSGNVLEPVALDILARLVGEGADVLTVLVGDGASGAEEAVVEAIRTAHPGVEVEVHEGGQPHYPLLFAVE
jgi:DAK2 domain fusion protein YloV